MISSPCTRVCSIDPATGWCRGCRRSLDEIAAWPAASDEELRAILARLDGRASR